MTVQKPLIVTALDAEGRGVARIDGKVCFLSNALPGETVDEFRIIGRRKNYDTGEALSLRHTSPWRVAPPCPHFGVCGGCALQHIDFRAQAAMKQRTLEDALRHIGQCRPEGILPIVYGESGAYRFRARLSVKYVARKGGVLVGFREKGSSFVADMESCFVLPPHVSALIRPLRYMIGELSVRDRLPQIELAVGARLTVLALRILQPLTRRDEEIIKEFIDRRQSEKHPLQVWLQPGKADTLRAFYPADMPDLSFRLPEFDLEMEFRPDEFTQVNHRLNEIMVSRAMNLLRPHPGEKIADMFCGLGNFSLPMARAGAQVTGIEGSPALVERARRNARRNGLSESCDFQCVDLFSEKNFDAERWLSQDKWLIDPPRDGALTLVGITDKRRGPKRIVYVSCKPATLARDTEVLRSKGYRLRLAGVLNMFPHTAHVESIALFER